MGEEEFYAVQINQQDFLDKSIFAHNTILDTILSGESIDAYRGLIKGKINSTIAIQRFELASQLLRNAFIQYGKELSFYLIINEFQTFQSEQKDQFLSMEESFQTECVATFMQRLDTLVPK